ncbi:MAG: beta-CASP ribonuclease aCPSF1 [Candidatus Thermoplasmatota archaeon]|nr:beta-CASP ribonuclease aCPSF1 [Candidatus Thermoplasmatota archaeon]MBU1941186.1 beta-CASP ribonuclease aCPSF1 [Candidatus Thermoplasmatota archaeon]
MTVDDVLREFKGTIRGSIPASVDVSDVEFEGALLVIYTKTPDRFAKNKDLVKNLAKTLQKRIVVRPDPTVLTDIDLSEKKIRNIIPKDAEITNIYFQPDVGEVTIEALKPGAAIGKEGQLLNEIRKQINWTPKIIRAPPIQSKTVGEIRGYLRQMSDERKEILQRIGKKLHRGVSVGEKYVRIIALGGFREVGRSCTMLHTQDSKVLIDCGIDVSSETNGSPYIHLPEVLPFEALDAVVITHAHLDHCGLLPLLYKYGYSGPVYCTPPTRDLMTLLQMDYLKVAASDAKKIPYSSEHIRSVIKHCIAIGYGDTTDITPDIRLTFHNAGHILGSSTCHFHIGEGLYNIAFSGDIKYERTWLFNPAVNHFPRVEAIVVESTYGGREDHQPSRREATERLKDIIRTSLKKKGKVLVPVFAVGRSQEVMIVLENLVSTKEIPPVPVYLDGMIWEATAIHTAYPEYLNTKLRSQIFQRGDNPLLSEIFKRVDSVEMREKIIQDTDPCVVLATSGMMNGGPVMEYFKTWASDERNSIVFVGYQAEGTLGRRIQRGSRELTLNDGGNIINIQMNMQIDTCDGFSGHSDRRQLIGYINNMSPRPERIIFGHGEESKCLDISSTIHKKLNINTVAPMNLECIRLV